MPLVRLVFHFLIVGFEAFALYKFAISLANWYTGHAGIWLFELLLNVNFHSCELSQTGLNFENSVV